MSNITYTKVIAEGFQSISEQVVFNLDNTGINIISGGNGIGKSTLLNSIPYAEFGTDFKGDVVTWEDKRHDGFRGTRVVVERVQGEYLYRVARHHKFKGQTTGLAGGDKLMVFKRKLSEPKFTKEHLITTGMHKSDTQLLINQQLGADEKTFNNSIFFGQRMTSLATTKDADRRPIFDAMFDSSFIDGYKDKAKKELDDLNTSYDTLESEIATNSAILKDKESRLESDTKILNDFNTTKEERISEARTRKNNLESKLVKARASFNKYSLGVDLLKDVKETEINKLIDEHNTTCANLLERDKLLDTVLDYRSQISKSEEAVRDTKESYSKTPKECSRCGSKLTDKAIATTKSVFKSTLDKEAKVLEVLNNKLSDSETKYNLLKGRVESDKTVLKDNIATTLASLEDISLEAPKDGFTVPTLSQEVNNCLASYEIYKKTQETAIKDVEAQILEATKALKKETEAKKPKVDIEAIKEVIASTKISIDKDTKELDTVAQRRGKVAWWVSKGFTNSGIKSFIFNSMLNRLNAYCHKYAVRLGFRVEFSIDMTKERKPIRVLVYNDGHERNYKALSGGQKQRVDICIAFAMHDMVTESTNINILVIDEILEGLDADGIDTVFELAREKAKTKSVYCISHLINIDVMGARIIEPVYDGKTTRLC